MCFLWNSIKIHFSPPGKVDPGNQRVCHRQGCEVTEHTELEITVGCLSLQTPTFKKPRSRTSTAERGGIWAASTQNCRTYRGSWWRTSRRCCREERRFPVSVCHLCSGQTEPWWEFSLRACAYPAPSQPPFTFFSLCFLLLTALDSKASNLSSLSKKYRSDAKYLNTRSTYAKLAAGGVFFIMLIVYVRFWWL